MTFIDPATPHSDGSLPSHLGGTLPPSDQVPFPDAAGVAGDGGSFEVREAFLAWFRTHVATLEPLENDWCPEWWEHPEAVARLFALWLAWEDSSRPDAHLSDRSSWWVYHWGHHAPILLDRKSGPFRDCDAQRGHLERATRDHVTVRIATPPDTWTPDPPTT